MKNIKTTSRCLFLAGAMACFFLLACNQSSTDTGADHAQAVKATNDMRLLHKGMEDRLDFLKTENKEFKRKVNALKNPDDSLKHIVALQDSLINRLEDMCKEQKRLIDENEDYIKKHERRSLDAAKVEEQHRQIQENYEQMQLHVSAIVQEVENIKIRIDGASLTENKEQ